MKTLLVIENESLGTDVLHIAQEITQEGEWETIKIDRLKYSDEQVNKLKEVLSTKKVDALLFQTTWTYWDSTAHLYSMLSKLPYSVDIYNMSEHNLSLEVLKSIDVKTREELNLYLSMTKHKVFNLGYTGHRGAYEEEVWYTSSEELEEAIEEIEIKEAEELDKQNLLDLQKKELEAIMLKPTDSYVRVGVVKVFNSEFDNLKQGDIVPILRTPSTDKSPNWGVWVAGVTEPVKLINSDGEREYEYIGRSTANDFCKVVGRDFRLEAEGLAREIVSCKRHTGFGENTMIGMLTVKINRMGEFMNGGDIQGFVQHELLDFAGVERRFNRSYFTNKLADYYKHHTFFKELNRQEEQKFINL
jgi:hypothetical protein